MDIKVTIVKKTIKSVQSIIELTIMGILNDPIRGVELLLSLVTVKEFIELAQEDKLPRETNTWMFKDEDRLEIAEQLVQIVNGHPWYAINMLHYYGSYIALLHRRIQLGESELNEYDECIKILKQMILDTKKLVKEYDDLRASGRLLGKTHLSQKNAERRNIDLEQLIELL